MYGSLANAGYLKGRPSEVGGYHLRPDSDNVNAVYENDKEIVLSISGTRTWDVKEFLGDAYLDATTFVGGALPMRVQGLSRWKGTEAAAIKLEQYAKSVGKELVFVGHSLGGYFAKLLAKHANRVYTFNKHTPVFDMFHTTPANEQDFSSRYDMLTVLNQYVPHVNPVVYTRNDRFSADPRVAHSIFS